MLLSFLYCKFAGLPLQRPTPGERSVIIMTDHYALIRPPIVSTFSEPITLPSSLGCRYNVQRRARGRSLSRPTTAPSFGRPSSLRLVSAPRQWATVLSFGINQIPQWGTMTPPVQSTGFEHLRVQRAVVFPLCALVSTVGYHCVTWGTPCTTVYYDKYQLFLIGINIIYASIFIIMGNCPGCVWAYWSSLNP